MSAAAGSGSFRFGRSILAGIGPIHMQYKTEQAGMLQLVDLSRRQTMPIGHKYRLGAMGLHQAHNGFELRMQQRFAPGDEHRIAPA
jgi:hypothetical protein